MVLIFVIFLFSVCDNARWECTDNPCAATCVFSPGNLFRTFDRSTFFFRGSCDYVMTQTSSRLDPNNGDSDDTTFTVWLDKKDCDSSHADSCSVIISLQIDDGDIYE